jgi:cytochrome P450
MTSRPIALDALFGGSLTSPVRDPHSVYRRLRRESPVLPISLGDQRGFLLTRYDDVKEALRGDGAFSNRSNARAIGIVMGRTIIEMDGPEHLKHRNLVTPALAPRALKGDFPKRVREIADRLIDSFATRGEADLVREFTFDFPLRVFGEILGLPESELAAFHPLAIDLTRVADDPGKGLAASRALRDLLLPLVDRARSAPGDDLIGRLAQARVDGEMLSDLEVVSFLRLLVSAGAETTYHLMGSVLFALLDRRDLLERLVVERGLLRAVIDETLRWESPIQIVTRETLGDVELGDALLPAGSTIIVGIGSANRDEARFADPERFDPFREDVGEHLSFGFGRHFCAGSRLAYLEAEIGLEALLDRLGDRLAWAPGAAAAVVGVAFRGPDRLPVRFGAPC